MWRLSSTLLSYWEQRTLLNTWESIDNNCQSFRVTDCNVLLIFDDFFIFLILGIVSRRLTHAIHKVCLRVISVFTVLSIKNANLCDSFTHSFSLRFLCKLKISGFRYSRSEPHFLIILLHIQLNPFFTW